MAAILLVAVARTARVRAQPRTRSFRVAIFDQWMTSSPSTPPLRTIAELERLGYVEGRSVAFEWLHAQGDLRRLPGLAREIVARRPDAILAFGGIAANEAARATRTIPVVAWMDDPVGAGLADASLRPTLNVTGFIDEGAQRVRKSLETLKTLLPGLDRFGVLVPDGDPNAARFAVLVVDLAAPLRLHTATERFTSRADFAHACGRLAGRGVRAALAWPAPALISTAEAVRAALRHRVALVAEGAGARVGMLMTFSPEIPARRMADQLDAVLRGVPPAQLPFERPERFVLQVNRKTASELGIPIPLEIRVLADRMYDTWDEESPERK